MGHGNVALPEQRWCHGYSSKCSHAHQFYFFPAMQGIKTEPKDRSSFYVAETQLIMGSTVAAPRLFSQFHPFEVDRRDGDACR